MEKIILIVSFVVVIGLGFLGFKYLSNIDKRIKNLESKAKETPPVNNLPTVSPVPQQNLNEIMKKNYSLENKDSPIVNEYQQYLNTQINLNDETTKENHHDSEDEEGEGDDDEDNEDDEDDDDDEDEDDEDDDDDEDEDDDDEDDDDDDDDDDDEDDDDEDDDDEDSVKEHENENEDNEENELKLDSLDLEKIENLSVEENDTIEENELKEKYNNMTVKELRDEYRNVFNIDAKSRMRKEDLINQLTNNR